MSKRSGNPAKRAWQPLERYEHPRSREEFMRKTDRHPEGTTYSAWRNDLYEVFASTFPDGTMHLSFKRLDRAAIRDWRHFQQIKNEVAGPEREAVELFPRESRLMDAANQFHLWVNPPGIDFNLGYFPQQPEVVDHDHPIHSSGKSVQRAWQPGLTTGKR